jgi:hypothetical protein
MAHLVFMITSLMIITSTVHSTFHMNIRTCDTKKNPSTFEIYELDCIYRGPCVYMYYEGPNTVHTLTIDRITEEAHVRVQQCNISERSQNNKRNYLFV